jgi:hypothetical protein
VWREGGDAEEGQQGRADVCDALLKLAHGAPRREPEAKGDVGELAAGAEPGRHAVEPVGAVVDVAAELGVAPEAQVLEPEVGIVEQAAIRSGRCRRGRGHESSAGGDGRSVASE